MSFPDLSESELISLAVDASGLDGNRQYFDELWRLYDNKVTKWLKNLSTEYAPFGLDGKEIKCFLDDVKQLISKKSWRKIKQYRGQTTFSSWLWKICRNTLIDEAEKEEKHRSERDRIPDKDKNGSIISTTEGIDILLVFRSDYYHDFEKANPVATGVETSEMKQILNKALTSKAQRGEKELQCSKIMRWVFGDELSYEEVATRIPKKSGNFLSERQISRKLKGNYPVLKGILRTQFGIQDINQLI